MKKSPDQVKVYMTALPSEPYVEIGIIDTKADLGGSRDDTLREMRTLAGQYGCDGIILLHETRGARPEISASCVVFDPPLPK